jgi:hypothetical protein
MIIDELWNRQKNGDYIISGEITIDLRIREIIIL